MTGLSRRVQQIPILFVFFCFFFLFIIRTFAFFRLTGRSITKNMYWKIEKFYFLYFLYFKFLGREYGLDKCLSNYFAFNILL